MTTKCLNAIWASASLSVLEECVKEIVHMDMGVSQRYAQEWR